MHKLFFILMAVAAIALTGCKNKQSQDCVVYGKIYTARIDSSKSQTDDSRYVMAEAMVIKDGMYVFVGSKEDAQAYITSDLQVIDWTGKGLIMPSCTNGHAHYLSGHAIHEIGTIIGEEDDIKTVYEILTATVDKVRKENKPLVFAYGWNYVFLKDNLPSRQQLDSLCSDLPIFAIDEEGHKALANTLCLQQAGIMDADGKPLKQGGDIRGGEIVMGQDGTPTGLLLEQAATYVRSRIDFDNLYTQEVAEKCVRGVEQQLLSEGYTMYMDGWSNYFYNANTYQAAARLDKNNDLHILLGLSYEMESWADIDASVTAAVATKKYASAHVLPHWIKLFMDGTVEGGTGYCVDTYPDGHQGIINWTKEEITDITRKGNSKGLSMHVHTMGDAAVRDVVDAFIAGGQKDKRNTVVHVRNVPDGYYQKMAENNIYATSGMHWHHFIKDAPSFLHQWQLVPEGVMERQSYPMKSYFDYGINMCSHTDFPALSGSPDDPFGIMTVAITGMWNPETEEPWWTDELLTRQQALQALTINGARQMLVEKERGSIETGKFADFILIDQDVLTCDTGELRNTRVMKTFFEGQEVFSRQ